MIDWDSHLICRTHEVDELQLRASRVLSPHVIEVTTGKFSQEGRLDAVSLGHLGIIRLGFGVDARVDPDCLETYYKISLALEGTASYQIGSTRFDMGPGAGQVISPNLRLKYNASHTYRQLSITIERKRLECFYATLRGEPVRHPIEFDPKIDLGSSGKLIRDIIMSILSVDSLREQAQKYPVVAGDLEHLLISGLIASQKSTYAEKATLLKPASPYYVIKAEEYIRANLAEPITLCHLAGVAGVSQRSLFDGFRKYRNTSPIALLRELRLQRVREELIEPSTTRLTVTEVAASYGFTRLGSFAAEYRKRFGELPSETLAAGKRRLVFN